MILDAGIYTAFKKVDVSQPGQMPHFEAQRIAAGFFGILEYETAPINPTGEREDTETTVRIRVIQNRAITNHCLIVLEDLEEMEEGIPALEVTRAYHGNDENGQPITDLTLREAEK